MTRSWPSTGPVWKAFDTHRPSASSRRSRRAPWRCKYAGATRRARCKPFAIFYSPLFCQKKIYIYFPQARFVSSTRLNNKSWSLLLVRLITGAATSRGRATTCCKRRRTLPPDGPSVRSRREQSTRDKNVPGSPLPLTVLERSPQTRADCATLLSSVFGRRHAVFRNLTKHTHTHTLLILLFS